MTTISNQLNEAFGESVLDDDYFNGERESMADVFAALTRGLPEVYSNPLDRHEIIEIERLLNQYLVLMNDIRELAKREAQLSA
jgi:hypothetical protein